MNHQAPLRGFALLMDAKGGASRFRSVILQLAVQGRLVDQIESEAPADEVLAAAARSANEARTTLGWNAKANSLKKSATWPHALPKGWVLARGADLMVFVTSGSRGWAQYASDEGALFLRIGNLDYGTTKLDLTSVQRVSPPEGAEGTRTDVQDGDILVSITGDTGMIGLAPAGLGLAYVNQHVALCRPALPESAAYIALAFTAPGVLGQVQAAQRGIKNSLGLDDIREVTLPLPPLAEQKRIVAKVDELMGLCDELEKRQQQRHTLRRKAHAAALDALTSADTPDALATAWTRLKTNWNELLSHSDAIPPLRQAILQLAVRGKLVPQDPSDTPVAATWFETPANVGTRFNRPGKGQPRPPEPFELPAVAAGWSVFSLEALVVDGPTNGYSPPGVKQETPVRVLTLSATTYGAFDRSKFKFVDEPIDETSNLWLEPGDLLIQRANTLEYVGVTAIYDGPRHTYIYPDLMMRIRLHPCLERRFIHLAMLAMPAREFLRRRASGTSSTMPKINQAALRMLPLPVPPPAEQRRIVAKVDELMALCDALERQVAERESLATRYAQAAVSTITAPTRGSQLARSAFATEGRLNTAG